MRIATYNVEWFEALFDRNANPLIDHTWSSRYNVTRADQWRAVGQVMRAFDADCIFVGYKIAEKDFFVLFLRVLKKATL